MKALNTLLLIAVALLAGYTYMQVSHLRAEVNKLSMGVAKRHVVLVSGKDDPVAFLTGATQNCKRAKTYLDRGDYRKARRELASGLQKLTEASKSIESQKDDEKLAGAWRDVTGRLESLWKQFAKESKPK
jgi:hypothetical protein